MAGDANIPACTSTAARVILGGTLLHFALGTIYCWGNSSIYVTSWLRTVDSNPDLTTKDTLVVFSSALIAQAMFMPVGGKLEASLGPRMCAFVSVICLAAGTFLSSAAVSVATLAAAQFLYGVGIGLGYIAPLTCGYKHLPERKGLVSGVIVGGFGAGEAQQVAKNELHILSRIYHKAVSQKSKALLVTHRFAPRVLLAMLVIGSFIFNFIVTAFVNPDDQQVPKCDDDVFTSDNCIPDYYAPDSYVVSRVPDCYRTLAVCYLVLGLLGASLLTDPPEDGKKCGSGVGDADDAYLVSLEVRRSELRSDGPYTAVFAKRNYEALWRVNDIRAQAL